MPFGRRRSSASSGARWSTLLLQGLKSASPRAKRRRCSYSFQDEDDQNTSDVLQIPMDKTGCHSFNLTSETHSIRVEIQVQPIVQVGKRNSINESLHSIAAMERNKREPSTPRSIYQLSDSDVIQFQLSPRSRDRSLDDSVSACSTRKQLQHLGIDCPVAVVGSPLSQSRNPNLPDSDRKCSGITDVPGLSRPRILREPSMQSIRLTPIAAQSAAEESSGSVQRSSTREMQVSSLLDFGVSNEKRRNQRQNNLQSDIVDTNVIREIPRHAPMRQKQVLKGFKASAHSSFSEFGWGSDVVPKDAERRRSLSRSLSNSCSFKPLNNHFVDSTAEKEDSSFSVISTATPQSNDSSSKKSVGTVASKEDSSVSLSASEVFLKPEKQQGVPRTVSPDSQASSETRGERSRSFRRSSSASSVIGFGGCSSGESKMHYSFPSREVDETTLLSTKQTSRVKMMALPSNRQGRSGRKRSQRKCPPAPSVGCREIDLLAIDSPTEHRGEKTEISPVSSSSSRKSPKRERSNRNLSHSDSKPLKKSAPAHEHRTKNRSKKSKERSTKGDTKRSPGSSRDSRPVYSRRRSRRRRKSASLVEKSDSPMASSPSSPCDKKSGSNNLEQHLQGRKSPFPSLLFSPCSATTTTSTESRWANHFTPLPLSDSVALSTNEWLGTLDDS